MLARQGKIAPQLQGGASANALEKADRLSELIPAAEGTRVVITERGEVTNPLFRFISRFLMGETGTMFADLKALGKHFGVDVTPEELPPPS